MNKKIIIYVLSAVVVIALLFGTYKLMNARTHQAFGTIISEVETDQKVVALTFDDGPSRNVGSIISLLRTYNVKATFFLIGNEMEQYPEETRAIVEAGHQVGNHTFSHDRMVFKTPSFIKKEIEKTNKLIKEAGYEEEIDFRPPNGKKLFILPYYLNKQGIDTITWNLEPDSFFTNANDKINYVEENIHEGSIILMHPLYDQSGTALEAIEGIIQSLLSKGYTFVTVEEMKQLHGERS
ncbi:polysaccharide deacetylase family protein [Cytobacillus purgationiresistens]|uniref:Chitin deacetylase n=1 Tax=Cytobacillus purgationiresistens TaxID=863449 RepID=A0ABU0ARC6_9BACI|nr:polysaccharide deacetylase family protein [Cytobacillus purgationiresistens]MDQ0273826.1 chitin deacetylase [Cytobacillus purgationiresistens]